MAGFFYFFSNNVSRHIQYTFTNNRVGASIFHDGENLDDIYGLQMSGDLETVSGFRRQADIIRQYVGKFDFLFKAFGRQVFENQNFFIEKFKSDLYGFRPDTIWFSDNSATGEKRNVVDPKIIADV